MAAVMMAAAVTANATAAVAAMVISANPDLEQLLTKTKQELWQAPIRVRVV